MFRFIAALQRPWDFHYDAPLLLALSLVGAFAVSRQAGNTHHAATHAADSEPGVEAAVGPLILASPARGKGRVRAAGRRVHTQLMGTDCQTSLTGEMLAGSAYSATEEGVTV